MISLIYSCADQALQPLRTAAGLPVHFTGEYLLSHRAQRMGWPAAGLSSANGSCHVWPTADGEWLALNLSRESDWTSLPALFQREDAFTSLAQVANAVAQCRTQNLLDRGRELGLALAIPLRPGNFLCASHSCIATTTKVGHPHQRKPRVLDLSSLWAGPLCSYLLQACGAHVMKVECQQRPDGARLNPHPGAQVFWQELNTGKELRTLDFQKPEDMQTLRQWIDEADIVIEGSRPRALRQLGINAERIVAEQTNKIWISITGYGRQEPQANWIAFGDDAAMAAGLCEWKNNVPHFIGDAVADPLTGIRAAASAWECWQQSYGGLLDISLYQTARDTAEKIQALSCC